MACILGIETPCGECRMCGKHNSGKKNTNADRIRNMTNEELADLLESAENAGYNNSSIAPKDSNNYPMDMLKWLESECGAE